MHDRTAPEGVDGGEPLEQFDSLDQERLAVKAGMWIFLATEILLFGGILSAYVYYRVGDAAGFALGSSRLDLVAGSLNTIVLLSSSLTMALAVRAAALEDRRAATIFLILTMALGATFLGIKLTEYQHKIHDGLLPGPNFREPASEIASTQLFYSFYFATTGLHAAHMVFGLVLLALMVGALHGRSSLERRRSRLEMAGLYWHLVDIVWVFLFPLLYLYGRHT